MQALPERPLIVRDLSSVTIDPRSGHVLIVSDESRLLVELDLQGRPRSFISLFGGLNGWSRVSSRPKAWRGRAGNIYVVGEPNRFYVFQRKVAVPARP